MSKRILEFVNNIVDKDDSEYYFINKRKRHFWHSRSTTISCRVRNKNSFNKAPDMALNIRAFLLNEEKYFEKVISAVIKYLHEEDMKQFRNYIASRNSNTSKKDLDKNIGLLVMSLTENEMREALNLHEVISCRLLGYEKELFYLKCYTFGILPVFLLRVLYHTKYSHLKLKKLMEYNDSLFKGLGFDYYLNKIRFL
ncbi:hypothetical protein LCGC14_1079570 [marine sediment metagenome]|uniref:Uncharacterized protein n=1 Tax=marine sediment metagenome TaxID=412755 RepID=A0A0F9MFT2_9ZZZZ|nr:MAG: hypothetical protein Lokiarch_05800 [Candidatus Lokiarchaeum sp. GC14_75]